MWKVNICVRGVRFHIAGNTQRLSACINPVAVTTLKFKLNSPCSPGIEAEVFYTLHLPCLVLALLSVVTRAEEMGMITTKEEYPASGCYVSSENEKNASSVFPLSFSSF